MSDKENIRKNILSTIIYYDILDFPLTSFEVWKYLTIESEKEETESDKQGCSLGEVVEMLEGKELKKHIEEFRGFYFLKGRKALVERRLQNSKNAIRKYKIAKQATRWLKGAPFVRMIAVTGTVAMRNSQKKSDIDFLVVLKKGRIWTGRLLVTLTVQLLGKRRYGKKIKDRICLNYFITTGSLRIKRQDLFAANEYSFIYPLFGFGVYKNFGRENIDWIKKYKPNFDFPSLVEVKPLRKSKRTFFEGLIDLFGGDRMETWIKRKQIEKIKRNPLTYKKGGYIEYTDENLIFLPEPQGPSVLEKYRALTSQANFL